jgi:hypothetical protein
MVKGLRAELSAEIRVTQRQGLSFSVANDWAMIWYSEARR